MRKVYFLLFCLVAFTTNAQIIDDNIDSYSTGPISPQASHWTTWSGSTGGAEDGTVTTEQANSGSQSMLIAEGQVQDVLLLLGDQTSGIYTVSWNVYVSGTGYWNIQESEIPGVQWNAEFFIGETGSGGSSGVITHSQSGATIAYLSNFWFNVTMVFNLDNSTFSVTIDGQDFLVDEAYPGSQLGAVNFFSIDADNRYYIDDVLYVEGVLSTTDFSINAFNVYPNPVADQLNIKSKEAVSKVAIYNVLGQMVNVSTPNTVSPSIDMSTYKSGIYFVEVTINNTTKTVKIVK